MSKQEQQGNAGRDRMMDPIGNITPDEWARAIEARDNDQQEPIGAKYPVEPTPAMALQQTGKKSATMGKVTDKGLLTPDCGIKLGGLSINSVRRSTKSSDQPGSDTDQKSAATSASPSDLPSEAPDVTALALEEYAARQRKPV